MNSPACQKFELSELRNNPPLALLAFYCSGRCWRTALVGTSTECQGCCRQSDNCYDLGDVHEIISPPFFASCVPPTVAIHRPLNNEKLKNLLHSSSEVVAQRWISSTVPT
jgi:hypothetical protein